MTNLTPREQFKLTGTLPADVIEELLDALEKYEDEGERKSRALEIIDDAVEKLVALRQRKGAVRKSDLDELILILKDD